jgi:hypothetical protein
VVVAVELATALEAAVEAPASAVALAGAVVAGVSNGSDGCSSNDDGIGGSCIAVAKVVAVAVAVEWCLSGSQVE